MEKFKDISVDPDTKIIEEKFVKIGKYDAKFEHWLWDGIYASSLIFVKSDVEHTTKEEIMDLIRKHTKEEGDITFSGKGKYWFFNYNFIIG